MSELPRYVLGIDPGKMTGVALYDLLYDVMQGWEVQEDQYGFMLEDHISRYRPAVVCESFVINAATIRNTQAHWSLENIGIARYLSSKYSCAFQTQLPVSAKKFATDGRLKTLGWYVAGKGHLVDAQRHVLLYLVDNGWWNPALD